MNKTILLVEDSPDVINLIRFSLEKSGYKVILASNGFEALEQLEKSIPDLLITDLMMPGMNGFELLEELTKKNIKVKTVVLALQKTDEDIVRSLGYGAIDFIQKPFSPREVVARINGIMSRAS
jgi:DNA-binding response OmpR family regulator